MTTYLENKLCERCQSKLPDDFVNLLCPDCYLLVEQEREAKEAETIRIRVEQAQSNPDSAVHPSVLPPTSPIGESLGETSVPVPTGSKQGILDPNYVTNPEADDKDQILANLAQFIYSHDPAKKRTGKLLWYPQRNMYTFIKNYAMKRIMSHPQYPKYIWKPKMVDVGCGSGTGSNILSQEADFVWGIDKNEWSIEFAKEAYTREKNGIYYSSQVTFDVFDVMVDTRDTMKFDYVVAIEVIEHIEDAEGFLKNIIQKFTKRDKRGDVHIPAEATEFFISTPNRAFRKIRKDRPENIYHVREWLAFSEFSAMLKKYYEEVEILNQKGEPISEIDEDKHEVVLAHCRYPKV